MKKALDSQSSDYELTLSTMSIFNSSAKEKQT